MKVVALVSGGKDSCYSMQLCKQHGHEIVALANLLPEETAPDELDSFMFQTVGHQLVGAYTACMGLPLFRKRISGSSSLQDLGYTPTPGDEVEDLYLLLAYVKECIPGVQAVASGAIASDYQRLRVENVCSRLNLVSLAYLWHQPQRLLLRGMVQSGLEAILVKVACLGLQPHKHLGRTIAALEPHLLNLNEMYGCNVCGEGGEYETLTLDCPMFTKGRIVLDKYEIEHGSAGVGHLVPVAFHVEPKAPPQPDASGGASAGAAEHAHPHGHFHSHGEHPPAGPHGRHSAQYAPDIRMVPPDYVPAPRTSDKCAAGVVNAHVNVHANATGAAARGYTANGPIATAAAAALCGLSLSASASPSGSPGAGSIGSPLATLTGSPGTAAASPLSPRVLGTYPTTAASTPPGTGGSEQLLASVSPPAFGVQVLLTTGSDYVQLACRAVRTRSSLASDVTELDTTAALNAVLAAAQQELAALHVSLSHCLFVHMFLANMGHFQAANGVYCKYFSSRDPPSRACVQVCLPQECPVMCEFLLARGAAPPPPGTPASVHVVRHQRKVLHVQSISTWAPSCIGPYSQATCYRGLVYLAGVIPLDPPTMMIAGGEITAQVLRAMASCEAVAIAQRSTVVGAALGLTVYLSLAAGTGAGPVSGAGSGGGAGCGCGDRSSGGGAEARALARSAVEALLEHGLPGYPQPSHRASVPSAGSSGNGMGLSLSGGGARPAAPRFGRSNTFGSGATPTAGGRGGQYTSATGMALLSRRVVLGADGLDEEEEEREAAAAAEEDEGPGLEAVLDRYLQPPEVRCPVRPSVLYVVVPALPRGALVEIQPLCLEVEALAVTRRLTAGQEGLKQQRRNLSHVDTPSLAHQPHHTHGHPGSHPPPQGAVTNTWSELPRTPRASMESFTASRGSTHGSSPLPWQCSTDALNGAMAQGLVDPTAVAAAAMSSPHRVSSQGMLHMLQRQRSSILSNSSGGGATPNGQQQQQRQQQLDGFGSMTLAAPSASPPSHNGSQGRTDRQQQMPRGPSGGSADQSSTSQGSSGSQVAIPALPVLSSHPPPRASGSSGTLRPRSSASGIMRDAIAASAAAAAAAAGLQSSLSRNSFSGGSSSSSAAAPFLSRSSLDGSILSFEVSSGAAARSSGTAFPVSLPRFSMSSIMPGPPAGMAMSAGAALAMGPAGVAGSAPSGPRQTAEAGGFAGGVERSHRSSDGSIGSAEGRRRSGNGSAGEGRRSASGLTSPAPTSVPDKEFQFAAPSAPPEEAAAGAAAPVAPQASPGSQGRSPFETATTAAAAAVVVTATPVSPQPFLPARSSSSFSSRVPPLAVPYLSVPVHPSPQPPSHNAPHSPGPTGPMAPLSPVQPAIATPPPAPGRGSGNDVMVSTVCCYGQVLRSIFHLPPSVFSPGVTTAQLTRRFRRAAASVLAAHGMDMSCLIWARVWYEKGAMVLDDEHGYGYCLRPMHAGGARVPPPVSDEEAEGVPGQLGEGAEEGRKGLGSRAGSRSRSRLGGVEEVEEEEGDGADEAGAIEREWRLGERRKAAWARTARTSADAAELDADATGGASGGGQFGRRTCPPTYDKVYDNVPAGANQVYGHGSHVSRRSPHRRHSLQVHHGHSPYGGGHAVHLSPHGHGHGHRSHGHHGGVHEAGAHHFHVSWVPVHRVMTNANPAPEVCVGVLELLAALPAS